jgi:hypothetical protein
MCMPVSTAPGRRSSVVLHEALGFQPAGVYRAVGYKLGSWHNVEWWQLALRDHTIPPTPPVDPHTVRGLRHGMTPWPPGYLPYGCKRSVASVWGRPARG